MTRQTIWFSAALALAAALISCGGDAPDAGGPGEAVEQFYRALNEGDYDSAKALYGAEARMVIDDPEFTTEEAFREWADAITHERTVSDVLIVDSSTSGDDATVSYEVRYRDGTTKAGEVAVTLEEGRWRLGLVQ